MRNWTTLDERSDAERPRGVPGDLVLGAVAGAAGVWVMDRVGWFLYDHEDPDALAQELEARRGGSDVELTESEAAAPAGQAASGAPGKDVAHVLAEKLARLGGLEIRTGQPNAAGMLVHYGLGVLPGALYAVSRRRFPSVRLGAGALYGVGLFVVNDEIAAPVLGLASGPRAYPWQAHARGLLAHTVLGVVSESALRLFDRVR